MNIYLGWGINQPLPDQFKANYGLFYLKKLGLNYTQVIKELKQVIQNKPFMT
jgi:hypothetical protein